MIFDLENITVGRFFSFDEETAKPYLELNEILKPVSNFKGNQAKPLGKMTFGEVAELKQAAISNDLNTILDGFCKVYSCDIATLRKSRIVEFIPASKHLTKSIIELIERENKALASNENDPDLEMAGVKRLAPFGEFATLINLGKEFGKSPMEIESWTYDVVFSILMYSKVESEISKQYQKLKSRPNGR
jgi:hypothetical protein